MISEKQHGFVKGRSSITQLLEVYSEINTHLDNNIQVDIIYLDFAKALDSVPHNVLIAKLQLFGINGSLLEWFRNYLSDRKQRVTIEGINSTWAKVTSGVPQGSILGPFMFLLFINDITTSISDDIHIALFPDDVKIWNKIKTVQD